MNNVKRVLLKLSGEALAGDKKTGFDEKTVVGVAKQIKVLTEQGYEIGIIIGGGNFWRGRTSEKIDRTKADSIGMACNRNELSVCIRDLPDRRNEDRDSYSVYLWCIYRTFLKG